VKHGEARVFYNDNNEPLGYMLYKTLWNEYGEVERILLYQMVILEESNVELITQFLASITTHKVHLTTVNFLASNPATGYLLKHGLKVTTEQVQMTKQL